MNFLHALTPLVLAGTSLVDWQRVDLVGISFSDLGPSHKLIHIHLSRIIDRVLRLSISLDTDNWLRTCSNAQKLQHV